MGRSRRRARVSRVLGTSGRPGHGCADSEPGAGASDKRRGRSTSPEGAVHERLLAEVAEGVVDVNGVRAKRGTRRLPSDLIYTLLDKTSRTSSVETIR